MIRVATIRGQLTKRISYLLAACALVAAQFVQGDTSSLKAATSDDALYVAFVYKFAQFARRNGESEATNTPIKFCFLAGSIDKNALSAIDGKRVGSRQAIVQVFESRSMPADCHIVFFGEALPLAKLCELAAAANESGSLTVSNAQNFDRCGQITFTVVDNRLRFIVNMAAVQQSRVTLSSELLNLAIIRRGD
jgi:hypothetical protein